MIKNMNPPMRPISFKKNLERFYSTPVYVNKPIANTGTNLIPYQP